MTQHAILADRLFAAVDERVTQRALVLVEAGRVAPGKLADLILVDGDPTSDVEVLAQARIPWVMLGGAVRKDLRKEQPAWAAY